jgi:hypothetical protein
MARGFGTVQLHGPCTCAWVSGIELNSSAGDSALSLPQSIPSIDWCILIGASVNYTIFHPVRTEDHVSPAAEYKMASRGRQVGL